jgi:uncharacterized protein YecE (DUF72 family)
MDALGEKLGPLLFQFPYFNKKAFLGLNDFLARLVPFLKKLIKGYRFAVEIRNKNWLVPQFVEALRDRHADQRRAELGRRVEASCACRDEVMLPAGSKLGAL